MKKIIYLVIGILTLLPFYSEARFSNTSFGSFNIGNEEKTALSTFTSITEFRDQNDTGSSQTFTAISIPFYVNEISYLTTKIYVLNTNLTVATTCANQNILYSAGYNFATTTLNNCITFTPRFNK